jgi:putative ATP-dependent endonuclease of the OLD family
MGRHRRTNWTEQRRKNEVFFAKRVVLFEEYSALVAFARCADLTGLFQRNPHLRRDVTCIDCNGKANIPLFQKVLNAFRIPYTVIHDEDQGKAVEVGRNQRVQQVLGEGSTGTSHLISPTDLEELLGYETGKDKPYRALSRVEELHSAGLIPQAFLTAMNWAYFGQAHEPPQ